MDITESMLSKGKTLKDMRMPVCSLVIMIKRGKSFIVPNGTVELKKHDTLLVIKETPEESSEKAKGNDKDNDKQHWVLPIVPKNLIQKLKRHK